MTFLEREAPPGRFAAGPATSAGDVWRSALDAAWYVDNTNARHVSQSEAYARRNQEIFDATGVRLPNPADQFNRIALGAQSEFEPGSTVEEYEARLKELAEQYPDAAPVIRADRSPLAEAREKARAVKLRSQDALERYDGPWGTGTLTQFAAGFAGAMSDPVNVGTMFLGPWKNAGAGIKGLLWMGVKQGAANAAVEAGMQPAIASWYKEAGLNYGVRDFLLNTGSAFALGAVADAGVRGAVRTVQAARGMKPRFDDEGNVSGWQTAEDALEEAAWKSRSGVLKKAAGGDTEALKQLARETGMFDSPETRAAFDALDDIEATATRRPGVDRHENDDAETQAVRSLFDPDEPPPVPPQPVAVARGPDLSDAARRAPAELGAQFAIEGKPVTREAGNGGGEGRVIVYERADGGRDVLATGRDAAAERYVFRGADGWSLAEVRILAARKQLQDGTGNVVESARLIREMPGAVDASVSLATFEMRAARALARLSDQAFAMVEAAEAGAQWGAHVGLLVEDRARHAEVLARLGELNPRNEAEARQFIGILGRAETARQLDGGIDDVAGREGQAQLEALEQLLATDIENARKGDGAVDEADAIARATDGVSLAQALDEVDDILAARDVVEFCKL